MEIFSTPAYDFQVDDIYYKILSTQDLTCEVASSYYSGDIVIPSTIACSGKTYSTASIGEKAFYRCSGLTSVTIPNSVTSIGEYAFCRCDGLTSVIIPNSVTSIEEGAFAGSGLTSVTIPNSVASIGNYAFRDCSGLTSITIPNSVTSIGEDAFYGCKSLTSVTIPNSVKSIGAGAFGRCSSLASVTIPNSVTYIGEVAFRWCWRLTSVISKMENPCEINCFCFEDKVYQKAKLYVPKGAIKLYKYSYGWKNFTHIVESDGPGCRSI